MGDRSALMRSAALLLAVGAGLLTAPAGASADSRTVPWPAASAVHHDRHWALAHGYRHGYRHGWLDGFRHDYHAGYGHGVIHHGLIIRPGHAVARHGGHRRYWHGGAYYLEIRFFDHW